MPLPVDPNATDDTSANDTSVTDPAPKTEPRTLVRHVDPDKLEARAAEKARREVLAELGIESVDSGKAAIDAQRKSEEARLTASEKTERALSAALKGREAAEAKVAEAEARAAAAESRSTEVALFSEHGVNAGEDGELVRYLLSGEKEKAGKAFNATKALAEIKAKRPYLFKGSQGAASTNAGTTTTTADVAAQGASPFAVNHDEVYDAMRATPKQRSEWLQRFNSTRGN